MTRSLGRRLLVLFAFAAAMGWLEAVVVVYIRAVVGIPRTGVYPPGREMMSRLLAHPWLIPTEQGREAATMIMLATVAWLAGRRWASRLGAFLVSFGVWDLVYYFGLYRLLGWPPSLTTMDLLFLIPPHPWWYQPVWLPVVISCGMIGVGLVLFVREDRSTEPRA